MVGDDLVLCFTVFVLGNVDALVVDLIVAVVNLVIVDADVGVGVVFSLEFAKVLFADMCCCWWSFVLLGFLT